MASRTSFRDWLSEFATQDDARGELARHLDPGKVWRLGRWRPDEYEAYLHSVGASPEAIAALRGAWASWHAGHGAASRNSPAKAARTVAPVYRPEPRRIPKSARGTSGPAEPDVKKPTEGTIAMSPAEFTGRVRDMALRQGIRWSPPGQLGFPACLVGPGGIRYRVLLRQSGTPGISERAWVHALQEAGADVGIWRPGDLETIGEELRTIGRELA